MKPFMTLKSVDEVRGLLAAFPRLPQEAVPLDSACGRVLAADWTSPEDLPGFDRSTVDGFAVKARDVFGASEGSPALLRCIGDCAMGIAPQLAVEEGLTARILTGGMLPQGADSVVMVEYSRDAGGGFVELTKSVAPWDNVVLHDDDATAGTVMIPAGRRLRPQEIGLLASAGCTAAEVVRRPRAVIISTGDEIVPFTAKPAPGEVRDVNSHSVGALCREAGAEVRFGGIVGDDRAMLEAAVHDALEWADVVMLSGGSSAGMRDHTVNVFQSMPESALLAHGAAISPGKPFILARSGSKCLMGLPGHIASALVCARVFLLPLLEHLQGAEPRPVPVVRARLTRSVPSRQGRRDYIRVRLTPGPEGWLAEPVTGSSGIMSGLVAAHGFAVCPENAEGLYEGTEVSVETC